jgi:hypothetical protein
MKNFLGYRDLEITYHNKLWNFAPGWVMGHGDEGATSRYAGGTAVSLARKIGMSQSYVDIHTNKESYITTHHSMVNKPHHCMGLKLET